MAEKIYRGYDNLIDLLLKADDVAEDISSSTKVAIVFKGNIYNSDNFPNAFDWNTNGANGVLRMDLGSIPATQMVTGRDKDTELIIYDANYPDGVVWGTFDLEVLDIEGTEITS